MANEQDDAGRLTERERRIVEDIAGRREELVALATTLIGFDTSVHPLDTPPREEAALQGFLAERLQAAGASMEVWEPAPEEVAATRMTPPDLHFAGRPQLVARFVGGGGGRSLLFNGHIDVVTAEPRERWSADPFRAVERDGRLHGRGACDMKGGVAAMAVAAEALAASDLRLAGDLLLCTVTDEESTGVGALAAVAHGVRADACVVPEPSDFDVWVACRGSLIPTITVQGRPGHAGMPQPHWEEGGAVNAIEKSLPIMEALRRLQEDWRTRSTHRHPFLAPGEIVPTMIAGGEWIVSYPATCALTYHVEYLPAQADEEGWGSAVEREIGDWVRRAAAADPWLAEHPPSLSWAPEVPPAEVPTTDPIAQLALGAGAAVGRPGQFAGLQNWYDGATFTRAGTPSIALGPGALVRAHTVDEYVLVDDLVAVAQALAVLALRFCGSVDA
jgi:acetylornithine deacetylase